MDDPRNDKPHDQNAPLLIRGSIDLFDINILPQRFLERKFTLISVIPWLILLFLMGSIYPAAQYALEAQKIFQEKQSELIKTRANLEINQSNTSALAAIQEEIDSANLRRDEILESYGGIQLKGTAWSDTLNQINLITPEGLSWVLLSQKENEIQLEGYTNSYQVVIDLNAELNQLDGLENAEIVSLVQVLDPVSDTLPFLPAVEGELLPSAPSPIYSFRIVSVTSGEELP